MTDRRERCGFRGCRMVRGHDGMHTAVDDSGDAFEFDESGCESMYDLGRPIEYDPRWEPAERSCGPGCPGCSHLPPLPEYPNSPRRGVLKPPPDPSWLCPLCRADRRSESRKCCNPFCGGNWGTNCYCCHHHTMTRRAATMAASLLKNLMDGLHDEELDDLQVAIDAQRSRGIGIRNPR